MGGDEGGGGEGWTVWVGAAGGGPKDGGGPIGDLFCSGVAPPYEAGAY